MVVAALAALSDRDVAGGHRHRPRRRARGRRPGLPAARWRRAHGPVAGALGGAVTVLPAWETLPFERVSPETETMGRRLAVLHALTTPGGDGALPPPPRVIVSPVRALLQRMAPLGGTAPIVVGRGDQVDLDALLHELVAKGYRREHQVEYRGEFAVRGGSSTCSPPRPTCRCASTCGATRSTG